MKKFLLGLLLFALVSTVSAETFEIGDSKLSFDTPAGWQSKRKAVKSQFNSFQVDFSPKDGDSTLCMITAIVDPAGTKKEKKATEAEVQKAAEQLMERHKADVVEKKVVLKEFKLKEGFGFYSTTTDARLVGKPPVKGDWKTATGGIIDLAPHCRLAVTILSDNPSDEHFKQAIAIVESVKLEKK